MDKARSLEPECDVSIKDTTRTSCPWDGGRGQEVQHVGVLRSQYYQPQNTQDQNGQKQEQNSNSAGLRTGVEHQIVIRFLVSSPTLPSGVRPAHT